MNRNNIILFTHSYPFNSRSEIFLDAELDFIPHDCGMTIVPLCRSGNDRRRTGKEIPVNESLSGRSFTFCLRVFFYMIFSGYFLGIFLKARSFRRMREGIKYLYGAYLVCHWLETGGIKYNPDTVFYCYWFTGTPLGLTLYKLRHPEFNNKIVSRAHGHDVYEDTVGVFIPYRERVFSVIDKLYVISDTGAGYLGMRYPGWKNKIEVSKLGVYPIETLPYTPLAGIVRVVSCSSVIQVKRVDLIFKSLNNFCMKYPGYEVIWDHIGDGELMPQVSGLIEKERAENLRVNMPGFIKNEKVREYYGNNIFDVMINMSESEGIPVSIMECISCGIPVIATDVGGNHEIVTESTGVLISGNFLQDEFDSAFLYIIGNRAGLRSRVSDFYNNNFNAGRNYTDFYKRLLSVRGC